MELNALQPKITAVSGDKILLEIPANALERLLSTLGYERVSRSRANLKRFRGSLKNAMTLDPGAYERQIRSEWTDGSLESRNI